MRTILIVLVTATALAGCGKGGPPPPRHFDDWASVSRTATGQAGALVLFGDAAYTYVPAPDGSFKLIPAQGPGRRQLCSSKGTGGFTTDELKAEKASRSLSVDECGP